MSADAYQKLLTNDLYRARGAIPSSVLQPTAFPVDLPTLLVLDEVGYEISDDEKYLWVLAALGTKDHEAALKIIGTTIPNDLFWQGIIEGITYDPYIQLFILFNFPDNWIQIYSNLPLEQYIKKPFKDRLFEKTLDNNPTFRTLLFGSNRVEVKKLPMGTEDPTTYEPIGSYYFECTNPKRTDYFNSNTFSEFCRIRGISCLSCPVDRLPMKNTLFSNCC